MTTASFTEAKLETAIINLLEQQGYSHVVGSDIAREPNEVLMMQRPLTMNLSNGQQAVMEPLMMPGH